MPNSAPILQVYLYQGDSVAPCSSVCPLSVPGVLCLQFTPSRKAVETSFQIYRINACLFCCIVTLSTRCCSGVVLGSRVWWLLTSCLSSSSPRRRQRHLLLDQRTTPPPYHSPTYPLTTNTSWSCLVLSHQQCCIQLKDTKLYCIRRHLLIPTNRKDNFS